MNDPLVEIKQATINDVSLILDFIKELATYEQLLHKVVATEESLKTTLFGNKPYAEVIISYYSNKPIGFALYFYNFSTSLGKPGIYLEDIYVKPEMRGKGIGKQMLAYLANLAKQKNCGCIEWRVLNWNKSAIAFYESISAKAMDEWTVFRVDDTALEKLAQQYDQ